MSRRQLVHDRVHGAYWHEDWNCAETTLRILSEVLDVTPHPQVLDAAVGMHGAGGYRAQCGLVEGALMFIGLFGRAHSIPHDAIARTCRHFAEAFEERFGSLLCRDLRPEGFSPDNPPHVCEELTRQAVLFDIAFLTDWAGGGNPQEGAGEPPEESAEATAPPAEGAKLSHLDDEGRVRMVDVGHKPATRRVAVARGEVDMKPETLRLIACGDAPKGDVLTTAQIAGIMAAKRTHELIPLCHPLPLTKVDVSFKVDEEKSRIEITATARCTGQTGVEMEALTAVSVAALTIYDMAKAVEKTMRIGRIHLISKTGGKSGDWSVDSEE